MNESLLKKLKKVRLRDLGHVFLFLLALLPARIYRQFHPHLWLICESEKEARDNGYWFYRYLRERQPETDTVYAIRYDAQECARVACLGPVVNYGSFRHWIYYLAAEVNISSQKYGKPNAAVCYLLEVVLGWLKNRRVFLQHGVTKDDLPFLHEDKAKFWMFCCAAEPEYAFIKNSFGYPAEAIQHVGFCRFDPLHDVEPDRDLLLIMPTWRMYLQRGGDRDAFLKSDYYLAWSGLLENGALAELLGRLHKQAVFVLHREMGAFEALFQSSANCITVLPWQEADISSLIREAGILITDYSSVYMDFAYMKKPLVYYQFDYETYRAGHLPTGYFDYERDGFGPVCSTEQELLARLEPLLTGGEMPPEYRQRVERFYTLNDDKNCERTYLAIREKLERENAL